MQFANISISSVAHGASNNGSINNNEVKNRSAINDVSSQIANSNTGADKEQVQQVLQQILTQIAQRAGEDKATNAINQIGSVIIPFKGIHRLPMCVYPHAFTIKEYYMLVG